MEYITSHRKKRGGGGIGKEKKTKAISWCFKKLMVKEVNFIC